MNYYKDIKLLPNVKHTIFTYFNNVLHGEHFLLIWLLNVQFLLFVIVLIIIIV